jgi:hypothetical protein
LVTDGKVKHEGRKWAVRLATLILGCLVLLAIVGGILKLILDDIGRGDACPYCSA